MYTAIALVTKLITGWLTAKIIMLFGLQNLACANCGYVPMRLIRTISLAVILLLLLVPEGSKLIRTKDRKSEPYLDHIRRSLASPTL